MATQPKKDIVILGSNDTAYQLQQSMLAKGVSNRISVVNDSDYIYCPSVHYPQLLAGQLSIKEVGILSNQFYHSQVNYLRTPPATAHQQTVINTVQDAHCVSVLHLPYGRRRYFTLHNTDNVIMASVELAQYQSLIVYGATEKAINYATEAALAGFKVWFVPPNKTLVNKRFDQPTQELIINLLQQANIEQITPQQAEQIAIKVPCLFTPYSANSHGLMRIYQQLNARYKDYPSADYQLVHGGDWYQLPLQACEQLINRIFDVQPFVPYQTSHLWSNKPSLPHKFAVNKTNIHYAGQLQPERADDCLTMSAPECGIYRKIVLTGDRIVGFLFAGDVRGSERIVDMMLTHRSISSLRNDLLFVGHGTT